MGQVEDFVEYGMGEISRFNLGEYQRFMAEVFNYFGCTHREIKVIDSDLSPHRIQTPAIRIGEVLYEGPVRFGQAMVILQRKFLREKFLEELTSWGL